MADNAPKPWRETPMVESAALSKAAGCRVFLKLETFQPSGSFKSRGIGNYILARLQQHSAPTPAPSPSAPNGSSTPANRTNIHFYSSSGGNAGLASVHAARALSYPCTVVVPLSTSPLMIAKIRAAGAAHVIQQGATWQDADAYMRSVVFKDAEARGETVVYVPPFDHADIWAGTARMMHEVAAQMPGGEGDRPDAVLCSVGGGGLLNGVVQGMQEVGWTDVPVVAAETDGADSLAASLRAGKHVTLPGITSQATSLGAVRVSARTWEIASSEYGREMVKSVVVSDAEAARACWRIADDERMLVELAGGVNVALCYEGREKLERVLGRKLHAGSKIVVILCGGSKITVDMLVEYKKEFGWIEKEVAHADGEVPSDVTAPNGA